MGFFTFPTGNAPAFVAKLMDAILAIRKVWELGWHNLWIESDSVYVV